MTAANNPINTSILSANRSWNDANGDYVPDCNLGNIGANGECGPIDNSFFGQQNPNAVRWDPDVLSGWGKRDYNWDMSAEVQQEIRQGLSMSVGYYYNTGGYFSSGSGYGVLGASKVRLTDNVLVTPDDHDPYCITAPVDSRLPDGGGYEVCGLYDISPGKFGQVESLITRVDNFGEFGLAHHFFQVSFDGRFANGIQIGGGVDTGRSVQDQCFVVDSPQQLLHCREVRPWKAQTQVKFFGSVPLPADVMFSATYQDLSGPPIDAIYAATNAEIMGSLGRPLAGGRSTATQRVPGGPFSHGRPPGPSLCASLPSYGYRDDSGISQRRAGAGDLRGRRGRSGRAAAGGSPPARYAATGGFVDRQRQHGRADRLLAGAGGPAPCRNARHSFGR